MAITAGTYRSGRFYDGVDHEVGAAEVRMLKGMKRIDVALGGGVVKPAVPVSEGKDWSVEWRAWYGLRPLEEDGRRGDAPWERHVETLRALPPLAAVKAWGEQWKRHMVKRERRCPHCGGRL